MLSMSCSLEVRDGKVFCTVCNETHPTSKIGHDFHTLVSLPFRHVLYVGYFCTDCDELVIDEEQ